MQWTLNNDLMLAILDYADEIWTTSYQMRYARNQGNIMMNRKQDMEGKACEYIAWYQAKSEGRKLEIPDLTIYKANEKSYSPDLVALDGLPNIHVKQISTYDGLSIIFSRAHNEAQNDPGGLLWGVMLDDHAYGNYTGYVAVKMPIKWVSKYASEVTKESLRKSKYCIRLEDLPFEYKLFT